MTDKLHIVVFAGGELGEVMPADVPRHDFAIAADSGLHQALVLDVLVDLVVGDMDSVSPAEIHEAEGLGAKIERFPSEKDETDLELALDRAVALTPDVVTVIGGAGGRFDHWLGNVMLMTSRKYAGVELRYIGGTCVMTVVRGERQLTGEPGSFVSLLAVSGDATGITTSGLKYALTDGVLEAGSVLGMSNEFVTQVASVTVEYGVVVAIQPDALPQDGPFVDVDEAIDPLLNENPGGMFN